MIDTLTGLVNDLTKAVSDYTPNLLAALAVLVLGYFCAWLCALLVRKVLERTNVDNRLANWVAGEGKPVPIEIYASRGVFYVVMLFVLAAFLQTLRLTVLTDPLQKLLTSLLDYIPRLIAAGALTLVAWLLALVVRRLIAAGFRKAQLDERLGQAVGEKDKPSTSVGKPIAEAAYWIVFLVFLPAILGALGIQALIEPVNVMMNKFFDFLPNLVGAAVTLLAGWFVARIVQRLASSVLASLGLDHASQRWNLNQALGKHKLSEVIGLVLYALILIPVIIAALDKLQLEAVTQPASEMLATIMMKIPEIFGVILIFVIAWAVGRVVGTLATNVLRGIGFDQVLVKVGVSQKASEGAASPAAVTGLLLQIAIMLVAGMAAADTLGFEQVAVVIEDFVHFAGQVVLGLILFGLGMLLAQVVANAIRATDSPRAPLLAQIARAAIIVLIGAMALRATGVAESIVNLAFGALVCGLAGAAALAFGLGGRKFASNQLEKWRANCEKASNAPKEK